VVRSETGLADGQGAFVVAAGTLEVTFVMQEAAKLAKTPCGGRALP
jgi:hypothetical protein